MRAVSLRAYPCPSLAKAVLMHTERFFFPTKGRLERRVADQREAGLRLNASVYAYWWGPLCVFLVFEKMQ